MSFRLFRCEALAVERVATRLGVPYGQAGIGDAYRQARSGGGKLKLRALALLEPLRMVG